MTFLPDQRPLSKKWLAATAAVGITIGILLTAFLVPHVFAQWIVRLPLTVTNDSTTALEDELYLVAVPTGRLQTAEYLTDDSTVLITNQADNAVPAVAGMGNTSGDTDTTYWLIRGDAPADGTVDFNADIGLDDDQAFLLPKERTAGDITVPSGALRSGGYDTASGLNVVVDLALEGGTPAIIAEQGTGWSIEFRGPDVADGPYSANLTDLNVNASNMAYRFTPNADWSISGIYGPDGCDDVGFVGNSIYTWPTITETDNGIYSLYEFDRVALSNATEYLILFDACNSQNRGSSATDDTTTYGRYRTIHSVTQQAQNAQGGSVVYYRQRFMRYGLVIAGAGEGDTKIKASGTGGDTLEADWDGSRATWRFRVNAGGSSSSLQKLGIDGSWATGDSATNITLTSSTDDVSVGSNLSGQLWDVKIGTPDNEDDFQSNFAAGSVTVGLSSQVLSGTIANQGDNSSGATWTMTLPTSVTSRSDFSTSWRALNFPENMHMVADAMPQELPDLVSGIDAQGASTQAVTPPDTEDTFGIVDALRKAGLESGIADAWWLILANVAGLSVAAGVVRMWSNLWVTLAIGLAANLAVMEISGQIGPWVVVWYLLWAIPAVALYQRRDA